MPRHSFCVLFLALLLSAGGAPVAAEVIIELSDERLSATYVQPSQAEKPVNGLFGPTAAKGGGMPSTSVFILPWIVDDSASDANATLFSVTNESFSENDTDVELTFFDAFFDEITDDFFTLGDNEIRPFNARLIPGLTIPDGVNRGLLQIVANDEIGADFFDVNFGENFASGDRALTTLDFCSIWRMRFLQFPGPGGTVLTFIINGPQGVEEEDPPTIAGEVFTEDGVFLNSFALQTDAWLLAVDALDLVIGDTEFGTIVFQLNTTLSPSGVIFENHSAFSRFSLGLKGTCKDLPL